MKPISFMRLKKIKDYNDALRVHNADDLIIQIKIDGWKALATKDDAGIKIYSRRGKEIQDKVSQVTSELNEILSDGMSLLGEISYLDENGQQSISATQSIIGSNPERATELSQTLNGKLIYYIYDILEFQGKDLTQLPFIKRDMLLKKVIENTEHVKQVKSYSFSRVNDVIKLALDAGGEGIVIKPRQSKYEYRKIGEDEPVGDQIKYKPPEKAKTDEVILVKYTLGKSDPKGYRKAIFAAYQYKNGELFDVGKLSGLDRKTEAKVKHFLDAKKRVTAEVSYQERTPAGKLRHMGWVRLRPEKPIRSVTVEAEQLLEQTIWTL